jgi:hypothetical protein
VAWALSDPLDTKPPISRYHKALRNLVVTSGDAMIKTFSFAFAAALAVVAAPAHAATFGAWVSGHGVDSPTCGVVSAPCRQIAYLLTNNLVVPSGEIDILDAAGFIPFAITQAVSINNDGAGTASIVVDADGQNAITINAGVFLNSAGNLSFSDCAVRHISNAGILIQPSSSIPINISKIIASDNDQYGIVFCPTSALAISFVSQCNISNNGSAEFMLNKQLLSPVVYVLILNNTFSNKVRCINVTHYADISVYSVSIFAYINKNYFEAASA